MFSLFQVLPGSFNIRQQFSLWWYKWVLTIGLQSHLDVEEQSLNVASFTVPGNTGRINSAVRTPLIFSPILTIGFRSRFSQCVDYMRFNEKSFCFRWQETMKLMLFGNTKTSSLVILCDLRYLTGNISLVMTKHMGVQRKLHRFAYLIVQINLSFYS